jgi:hypothetical protein
VGTLSGALGETFSDFFRRAARRGISFEARRPDESRELHCNPDFAGLSRGNEATPLSDSFAGGI